MPPGYVKTIQDELFYEYAKLISRSAFGKHDHGFIGNRVKALRDGSITMSGTIKEWAREQELPKECVFCGSTDNLEGDHLIPRARDGANIADNMVLSCRTCNASRGKRGIFEWLGLERKDRLHRLVAGKYLKQLLALHEAAGTLDIGKKELAHLCTKCRLEQVCIEWGTKQKLTCLCLESVLS